MACASVVAAPAWAAPSYTISFERSGFGVQYGVTQATPFEHGDSYTVPGVSNAVFSGSAFAHPGHVGIDNRVEQLWTGQATSTYGVYSTARTDDFVISGPPGFVTGSLHLRVRASLSRAGGYAGNASHGARLNVDARARSGLLVAVGDLYSTNQDTHGTGVLAGLTSPDLDFPFVLSGTFPVGSAFDVYIRAFGIEFTYGNGGSVPNPGYARTDAGSNPIYGLFLEEVGGQVMTLPAGYTLNSPGWGIVDNHSPPLLGVESEPGGDGLRLSAYPNPCFGNSTVSFDLPHGAHVRLQVFDVCGRLVRTLADAWYASGTKQFRWDGRADDGVMTGAGIYFARGEADARSVNQRIVRVR